MTDQRSHYLIVRPGRKPTAAELRNDLPNNQALVMLKDPFGNEHWFHLEYAQVWPLELDD